MNKNIALECKHITKTFGTVVANKDCDLTVFKGEILAIEDISLRIKDKDFISTTNNNILENILGSFLLILLFNILPSKSLYKIASENFENGSETFINVILYEQPTKEVANDL